MRIMLQGCTLHRSSLFLMAQLKWSWQHWHSCIAKSLWKTLFILPVARTCHLPPFKFSRNKQSWQCWHFCTISNINEWWTVKRPHSFKADLHLNYKVTDFSIHLIFKFKQYKNANFANFLYYGKTRSIQPVCLIRTQLDYEMPTHAHAPCRRTLHNLFTLCYLWLLLSNPAAVQYQICFYGIDLFCANSVSRLKYLSACVLLIQ